MATFAAVAALAQPLSPGEPSLVPAAAYAAQLRARESCRLPREDKAVVPTGAKRIFVNNNTRFTGPACLNAELRPVKVVTLL